MTLSEEPLKRRGSVIFRSVTPFSFFLRLSMDVSLVMTKLFHFLSVGTRVRLDCIGQLAVFPLVYIQNHLLRKSSAGHDPHFLEFLRGV